MEIMQVVWEGEEWKGEVESALLEMKRVLRGRGTMIIIETLGTGNVEPVEKENLQQYFSFLEERGFQRSWIRTDYRFDSREEALELVEFFFGEEMLSEIGNESKPVLPECTGFWWLKE